MVSAWPPQSSCLIACYKPAFLKSPVTCWLWPSHAAFPEADAALQPASDAFWDLAVQLVMWEWNHLLVAFTAQVWQSARNPGHHVS